MIYGLFQYYHDELANWMRVLEFYKEESREFVGKIGAVVNQQVISSTTEKETSGFIDQFMVQQQQFDHITNQITSQQLRLEKTTLLSGRPVELFTSQKQDVLRSVMHKAERNFIRTKYACAVFLSSLLNEPVLVR